MELLDRYLQAVKSYLPPARQGDIIQELRENILAQAEDKEAELGQPLNEAEQEALLKQYGHPMLLASRYGPRRHLIGPAVFPMYWHTLKISLGIVVIVCAASGRGFADRTAPGGADDESVCVVLSNCRSLFAWMTLAFAGLDYCIERYCLMEKWGQKWEPRSLPAVWHGGTVPPRSRRLAALISSVAFGAWWLLALKYPFLMLGPTWGVIKLSPVWERFYIPFLLLVVLTVAQRYVQLVWPQRKTFSTAAELLRTGGGTLVCYLLVRAGNLIEPTRAARIPGSEGFAGIYNACVLAGMSIGGVVSGIELVNALWNALSQRGDGGLIGKNTDAGVPAK